MVAVAEDIAVVGVGGVDGAALVGVPVLPQPVGAVRAPLDGGAPAAGEGGGVGQRQAVAASPLHHAGRPRVKEDDGLAPDVDIVDV